MAPDLDINTLKPEDLNNLTIDQLYEVYKACSKHTFSTCTIQIKNLWHMTYRLLLARQHLKEMIDGSR